MGGIIGAITASSKRSIILNERYLSKIKRKHKNIKEFQPEEEIRWSEMSYYYIPISGFLSFAYVRIDIIILFTDSRLLFLLKDSGNDFKDATNKKLLVELNNYPVSLNRTDIAAIKVDNLKRKKKKVEIRTIFGKTFKLIFEEISNQHLENLRNICQENDSSRPHS